MEIIKPTLPSINLSNPTTSICSIKPELGLFLKLQKAPSRATEEIIRVFFTALVVFLLTTQLNCMCKSLECPLKITVDDQNTYICTELKIAFSIIHKPWRRKLTDSDSSLPLVGLAKHTELFTRMRSVHMQSLVLHRGKQRR